jgi:hypothetical protein
MDWPADVSSQNRPGWHLLDGRASTLAGGPGLRFAAHHRQSAGAKDPQDAAQQPVGRPRPGLWDWTVLAAAPRRSRPSARGGRLFVYTRTPEQNARTIWGRWFPGFTEREQRLYSEATLTDERLRAQVEGRHHSTFSLYRPDEPGRQGLVSRSRRLRVAEDGPLASPVPPTRTWRRSIRRRPARPGGPGAGRPGRGPAPRARPAAPGRARSRAARRRRPSRPGAE